jgi:hypothetical protein
VQARWDVHGSSVLANAMDMVGVKVQSAAWGCVLDTLHPFVTRLEQCEEETP